MLEECSTSGLVVLPVLVDAGKPVYSRGPPLLSLVLCFYSLLPQGCHVLILFLSPSGATPEITIN